MDVDLSSWVGVGLGGTYGCRCGVLYVHMLGVVYYVGLVCLKGSFSLANKHYHLAIFYRVFLGLNSPHHIV